MDFENRISCTRLVIFLLLLNGYLLVVSGVRLYVPRYQRIPIQPRPPFLFQANFNKSLSRVTQQDSTESSVTSKPVGQQSIQDGFQDCATLFTNMNFSGFRRKVAAGQYAKVHDMMAYASAEVAPGCKLSTCMRKPGFGACFHFSSHLTASARKFTPAYFLKCECSS